jgi:hypothetical protein
VTRLGAALTLLRAAWGVALLAVPARVLGALERTDHTRAQVLVARILGARHVIQAGVVTVVGGSSIRREGAVVDGIHALTSLGMAAASRRWRRLALTDAAIAAGLCAAGVSTAREADPPQDVGALQQ